MAELREDKFMGPLSSHWSWIHDQMDFEERQKLKVEIKFIAVI